MNKRFDAIFPVTALFCFLIGEKGTGKLPGTQRGQPPAGLTCYTGLFSALIC